MYSYSSCLLRMTSTSFQHAIEQCLFIWGGAQELQEGAFLKDQCNWVVLIPHTYAFQCDFPPSPPPGPFFPPLQTLTIWRNFTPVRMSGSFFSVAHWLSFFLQCNNLPLRETSLLIELRVQLGTWDLLLHQINLLVHPDQCPVCSRGQCVGL